MVLERSSLSGCNSTSNSLTNPIYATDEGYSSWKQDKKYWDQEYTGEENNALAR